jgi:putative tryptophan/tyrosine transport system substrate-binding protein
LAARDAVFFIYFLNQEDEYMKKFISILLVVLLVGCGSKPKDNEKKKYKIGVLQLADHPSLDATYEGLKEKLDVLMGADSYTIEYQNAQGKPDNISLMSQQLVDAKVDLIYAIATNAAQGVYAATDGTGIPVVFNAVTDPVDAGIVKSMDKSGTHAIGVSDVAPIDKQLALIKEILPEAKNIGILFNTGESNSAVQIAIAEQEASKLGLNIIKQGVSDRADIALSAASLLEKVDAIYNITDNMMVEATALIVDAANMAKKPVFAAEDGKFDLGLLAAESIDYKNLGELGAELVKQILVDGKNPAEMPVSTVTDTVLYISKEVADKLNITLPDSVLSRGVEKK